MSMLLVEVQQWLIPVILLVACVGIFVMSYFRNKKTTEQTTTMINSIRKGDKVKTYSGFIGKIIEIREKDGEKTAIIETGSAKNSSTFTIDINAVYCVIPDEKAIKAEQKEEAKIAEPIVKQEEKVEEEQQQKPEVAAEVEKKETKPAVKKTATKSKSSKK